MTSTMIYLTDFFTDPNPILLLNYFYCWSFTLLPMVGYRVYQYLSRKYMWAQRSDWTTNRNFRWRKLMFMICNFQMKLQSLYSVWTVHPIVLYSDYSTFVILNQPEGKRERESARLIIGCIWHQRECAILLKH